jgi:hypothetical protein
LLPDHQTDLADPGQDLLAQDPSLFRRNVRRQFQCKVQVPQSLNVSSQRLGWLLCEILQGLRQLLLKRRPIKTAHRNPGGSTPRQQSCGGSCRCGIRQQTPPQASDQRGND